MKMPRLLATDCINKLFYICVFKLSKQIAIQLEPGLSSFLRDIKHDSHILLHASLLFWHTVILPAGLSFASRDGWPLGSEGCCVDVHWLKSCSSASLADTRKPASSDQRNGVPLFVCLHDLVLGFRAADLQACVTPAHRAPSPISCCWPKKRSSVWKSELLALLLLYKWEVSDKYKQMWTPKPHLVSSAYLTDCYRPVMGRNCCVIY